MGTSNGFASSDLYILSETLFLSEPHSIEQEVGLHRLSESPRVS